MSWLYWEAGEIFSRLVLGLGDPALLEPHPTIEYLYRPDQRVKRFGNLFMTNRYGMRSDDFPPRKQSASEFRVLIIGDSVVNGGTLTDQSQLATEILKRKLSDALHRPVIVGNVSAGSWGPPNELAWLQQFGTVSADVVVFVFSSSDWIDAPTFAPLNPIEQPTEKPISALWEGFTRYLPRYSPFHKETMEQPATDDEAYNDRDAEVSLAAISAALGFTRARSAATAVVLHWTQEELRRGHPLRGHDEIARVVGIAEVPMTDDADGMKRLLASGQMPYRDDIHPNAAGQTVLAEVLTQTVINLMATRQAAAPWIRR